MQIMGNTPAAARTFAITLPAITVGTALFVFNLESVLNIWSTVTEQLTDWLRLRMRQHRRKDWKVRAIALREDIALSRAPVRKARRQSSGWVYLLFLLEYVFVALPISEIMTGLCAAGLIMIERTEAVPAHRRTSSVMVESGEDKVDSTATKQAQMKERIKQRIEQSLEEEKRKEREKVDEQPGKFVITIMQARQSVLATSKKALKFLIGFLRTVLIPVWTVLLGIEYLALVAFLFFRSRRKPLSSTEKPTTPSSTVSSPPGQATQKYVWIQAWKIKL